VDIHIIATVKPSIDFSNISIAILVCFLFNPYLYKHPIKLLGKSLTIPFTKIDNTILEESCIDNLCFIKLPQEYRGLLPSDFDRALIDYIRLGSFAQLLCKGDLIGYIMLGETPVFNPKGKYKS
jgi:hypothetical protein